MAIKDRRIVKILLVLVALIFAVIIPRTALFKDNWPPVIPPWPPAEQPVEITQVTSVIDGDTIVIEDGRLIRYIGIDAPEAEHEGKPAECFAAEATAKNRELVEGKTVRLEKDVSDTDKYGRLLRYVWVDDVLVNETLVREGFARTLTVPPDIKNQSLFSQKQAEAKENLRGMWGDTCR